MTVDYGDYVKLVTLLDPNSAVTLAGIIPVRFQRDSSEIPVRFQRDSKEIPKRLHSPVTWYSEFKDGGL